MQGWGLLTHAFITMQRQRRKAKSHITTGMETSAAVEPPLPRQRSWAHIGNRGRHCKSQVSLINNECEMPLGRPGTHTHTYTHERHSKVPGSPRLLRVRARLDPGGPIGAFWSLLRTALGAAWRATLSRSPVRQTSRPRRAVSPRRRRWRCRHKLFRITSPLCVCALHAQLAFVWLEQLFACPLEGTTVGRGHQSQPLQSPCEPNSWPRRTPLSKELHDSQDKDIPLSSTTCTALLVFPSLAPSSKRFRAAAVGFVTVAHS